MRGLIGALVVFLFVAPAVRAGGCGYAAYSYAPSYSYTPSYGYSYFPASVYNGAFFSAGYYRLTGYGWDRYGYGIDYGTPAFVLPAVPLLAPAVAAYPVQSLPQAVQQAVPQQAAAAGSNFTPQEADELRQLLKYLKEQQKQATPPPASGAGN